MFDKIRLATDEETEAIRSKADLIPGASRVLVQGPIVAVHRVVNELDPVFFNGASDRQKVLFLYGMQNLLLGGGVPAIYFNIPTEDESYQEVLKKLGAERTNANSAEYRYKLSAI